MPKRPSRFTGVCALLATVVLFVALTMAREGPGIRATGSTLEAQGGGAPSLVALCTQGAPLLGVTPGPGNCRSSIPESGRRPPPETGRSPAAAGRIFRESAGGRAPPWVGVIELRI